MPCLVDVRLGKTCSSLRRLNEARLTLADLLPPHGVVESPRFDQRIVAASLNDATPLEHVDRIGVRDRTQPMCNQDHHVLPTA